MTPKSIVQVEKNQNENNTSLLRRFSRRVFETGGIFKAKSNRYFSRDKSDYARKQDALRRIAKRKEYERLFKLGKIKPGRRRR